MKKTKPEEKNDVSSKIKKTLNELLGFVGVDKSTDINITENEDGVFMVYIEGDDLSYLIGYHGESLEGLQSMLGLILYKDLGEWTSIVVDINGYRKKRQETVEDMARSLIDRVRFFGEDVELPPMSPFDRRQVHVLVSDYDDIESASVGEGPSRRVTLKLKRE